MKVPAGQSVQSLVLLSRNVPLSHFACVVVVTVVSVWVVVVSVCVVMVTVVAVLLVRVAVVSVTVDPVVVVNVVTVVGAHTL